MALNARPRWHFWVRLFGLTGLFAGIVGLVLWVGLGFDEAGPIVALSGAAAVALTLLVEVRGLVALAASRRGAVGLNVFVQVALATALLIGANVFSFLYYQRFDGTRDHAFTIPADVRARLAQLRDETDVVVYQQYVSFGQRAENRQDKYDLAAQKKIVEKVRDLAELFQDLGPRFRVQVLDIQDDYFPEKMETIKREAPKLAAAIEKAPENSVFFYSKKADRVQRLSFSDVYQLDKTASQQANGGAGNLVLVDQGVGPFARKVFGIEERRPRVGFAVVHEYLGQEGSEDLGLRGVKKMFATRGFEGHDVILKRWQPRPEPTVMEHEENRFEALEFQRNALERALKEQKDDRKELAQRVAVWASADLAALNTKYALAPTLSGYAPFPMSYLERIRKEQGSLPPLRRIAERDRAEWLEEYRAALADVDGMLTRLRERLDRAKQEQAKLHVDDLAERRRITDLRAKFNRLLADIDLLVVPRMTLFNVLRGERIPPAAHALDEAQVAALKDYIKAGKPVLFCLGPVNDPGEPSPITAHDSVEKLLAEFGVELPRQTVLFDAEGEALTDRGEGLLLLGTLPEVPPVTFEPAPASKGTARPTAPQPIRTSLRLTARSFGSSAPADLRVRHPRPVYRVRFRLPAERAAAAVAVVAAPGGLGSVQAITLARATGASRLDESAVFLLTDSASWNDEQPFPTEKRVPHYERPKADDPSRGTVRERRRGPFPIGIAFETPVPASWYDTTPPAIRPEVRLAVIGHGGVFMGERLTPMREKMLLDVSNWLLGRDDLLARDEQTWSYPRVELDATAKALWTWGALLGLPLLFVYLGTVVWMVRQMR